MASHLLSQRAQRTQILIGSWVWPVIIILGQVRSYFFARFLFFQIRLVPGPMTILPLRRLYIERQIQPEMLSFVSTDQVLALFNM
jgi:hypothetical protein